MSLASSLSISTAGLADVSTQFAIISQNVANVGTPGYATEVATQTSVAGDQGGVVLGPTIRQGDPQLEAELMTQNAATSAAQTRQAALGAIDTVQGTPGGGTDLSSLLATLQNSFSTLQEDPSSTASQTAVVNAASGLTSQINALSNAYQAGRQNAQNTIVSSVATLNTSLATIGTLSNQIMQAQAAGQSTGDLENQRAAAMQSISQLVSAQFIQQPDGDMLVATSGGVDLPTHFTTPPLSVSASTIGPNATYPATVPGIMMQGVDVTDQMQGGQIGAAVSLRDTELPTDQAELDEFSETLSNQFAAQGLTLFSNPDGTIPQSTSAPTQSGYVGYAATIGVNPAVAANPTLVRDGTQAVAGSPTGASAFTPNPAGGPAGFTDLITRVLNYTFGSQVQAGVEQPAPATTGLGVNGNLSAPYSAPTDLSAFATALVSAQASDSADATTQATTQSSVQSALQSQVSSATGVSIDAQMSNLVQLQNAYGANAKIISTIQSLWGDLFQMVQ